VNGLCGWTCLVGIVVILGFVGLFTLLFSPRVNYPFWFFAACAVCLTAALGALLGVGIDIALRHRTPVLAAAAALAGVVVGAYFAFDVYRNTSTP
jgi:uncharacterized membrane protein